MLPRAAARGRRAAARARQASGGIPARAHARPAGAERLQRHQGRAGGRGPGARGDAGRAGRGVAPRSDDHRARRRRAGRGRGHAARRRQPGRHRRRPAAPATTPDTRLGEARARAAGAALVVVDDAPTAERLASAIYGGARAYLPRAALELLGRVAAAAAARRHGESLGVKIVEALAQTRHPDRRGAEPAADPAARRRRAADRRRDHAAARTARSSRPGTRCWSSTTRPSC